MDGLTIRETRDLERLEGEPADEEPADPHPPMLSDPAGQEERRREPDAPPRSDPFRDRPEGQ